MNYDSSRTGFCSEVMNYKLLDDLSRTWYLISKGDNREAWDGWIMRRPDIKPDPTPNFDLSENLHLQLNPQGNQNPISPPKTQVQSTEIEHTLA